MQGEAHYNLAMENGEINNFDDEREFFRKEFNSSRNKIKEEIEKSRETKKKTISQGYEDSFKIIASTISTAEILSELEKKGYLIGKIEWSGEIHAPSLDGGFSVNFKLIIIVD
nr:12629_t:CDS:1 [Entrophospora candida]